MSYMNRKVSAFFFHRKCFSKMKDFSRLPPIGAVTYTVKVVVSKKWCKIDTLLLHTTNRKYRYVPFPKTVEVIRLLQDLSNAIRRTFVRHLARFQLTRRVARPSAIAELLVTKVNTRRYFRL